MLSILTQFLSNRPQHVMLDDCRSKLVNVVSGVLDDSVYGPLLFILYTSVMFTLKNKLIGYADESILMNVVPTRCVRVTITGSLTVTSARLVSGMAFEERPNASKTKTMIVSTSHTMHPSHSH